MPHPVEEASLTHHLVYPVGDIGLSARHGLERAARCVTPHQHSHGQLFDNAGVVKLLVPREVGDSEPAGAQDPLNREPRARRLRAVGQQLCARIQRNHSHGIFSSATV